MASKKKRLSGTVVPVVLSVTVAVASQGMAATGATGENPTAPKVADDGTLQLAACNPCNPCGACNPCAAACNPCNPCGACNPCNPCNPCAGGGSSASSDCDVPRLASACNPCNPCAAACNPCNPCGGCNPCNPCGAGGGAPELSAAEAKDAYACIQASLKAGYAKSGNEWAAAYSGWTVYNTQPYISDTHGGRYVNNHANGPGANYGEFENAGPAPEGTVLAKDSFSVKANGKVGPGPLFLMEKMTAGFSADTQDWRYTLILPNGKVIGTTGGEGSDKVGFCAECHLGVEEQDSRFFLPEDYRVQ